MRVHFESSSRMGKHIPVLGAIALAVAMPAYAQQPAANAPMVKDVETMMNLKVTAPVQAVDSGRPDEIGLGRTNMKGVEIMKRTLTAAAVAALLAGCAGEPQTYTLDTGSERETVTVPKGTMTGTASVGDANALAKEIADSNNAAMAQFNRMGAQMSDLQSTENKELATSQAALEKLERLAAQQGTGSITLFFAEGSAHLDQFQYERLVSFLDYLARESRGRNVILVSIGSASAVGPAAVNLRLSTGRSEAPLPVIDQYLVDIPHQFHKVTAIGDLYAPKNAPMQVEKRYQNVRIIAAYDTAQLAATPGS